MKPQSRPAQHACSPSFAPARWAPRPQGWRAAASPPSPRAPERRRLRTGSLVARGLVLVAGALASAACNTPTRDASVEPQAERRQPRTAWPADGDEPTITASSLRDLEGTEVHPAAYLASGARRLTASSAPLLQPVGGNLPDGDPCVAASECASGVCGLDERCGCASDADCSAGSFCAGASRACTPKQPNATSCANANQCASAVCSQLDGLCGCGGDGECGAGEYCTASSRRCLAAPALVAPSEGRHLASSTVRLTVSCTSGAEVTVTVTGGAAPATCGGTCVDAVSVCEVALADGSYSASAAQVADAFTSPASAPRAFTVDTIAPDAPTLTRPTEGLSTRDSDVAAAGTCEAGATVRVSEGASELCVTPCLPDGTFLCEATRLFEGTHTWVAAAEDAAGNRSADAAVAFTVDLTAPAAPSVLRPGRDALLTTATPSVEGTCEPLATVRALVDGVVVCSASADAAGIWSCAARALVDGPHVASAVAEDAAGNVSGEAPHVPFAMDTAPPTTPSLILPTANQRVAPPTVFVGRGEPGATVAVDVDGATACTALVDASGDWSCMAAPPLALGDHQALATSRDDAGLASAPSRAVRFTVAAALPPGPPTLFAPSALENLRTSTPTFLGSAEPGAAVTVWVDGALACTATASGAGSFTCDAASGLGDGPHAVRAVARNATGSSVPSFPVRFSVDTAAPPAPELAEPSEGATVGPRPVYAGTAEAGALVVVSVDGADACTATADAQGRFACAAAAPLADGTHGAVAVATDAAGLTSPPSAPRGFDVASSAPPAPPLIARPVSGAHARVSDVAFAGTAAPGATVAVSVDGAAGCATQATPSGDWACTAQGLADGPHAATATATLPSGTSAPTAAVPFVVDPRAPAPPVLLFPASGANVDPRPVYAGTAEPGAHVRLRVDGHELCRVLAHPTTGTFECPSPVPLASGAHQAIAVATDAAGGVSAPSAPRTFNVVPTTPFIAAPPRDALVREPTLELQGSAEPRAEVIVRADGEVLCTAVSDAQGAWSCTAERALADGRHELQATAEDGFGHRQLSSLHPVVVDTVAPAAPTLAAPTLGAEILGAQVPFSGEGEPGTTVSIVLDGREACTARVQSDATWRCTILGVTEGTHEVRLRATDGAGNVSPESAGSPFRTRLRLPAPVVAQPAAEAALEGPSVTFRGRATPGVSVTVLAGDGSTVCSARATDAGAWSCRADLEPGEHRVTVIAASPGLVTASSEPVVFSVLARVRFAGGGWGCAGAGAAAAVPLAGWLVLALALPRRRGRARARADAYSSTQPTRSST